LIAAGVARVVVAMIDPNPQVAGRGVAVLRSAGIVVEVGLAAEVARALNRGFVQRWQLGRPFVICKLGASLDGRTALANGQSQWITSQAARLDVQRLRAQCSAVMTGIGTVLADQPSLTVRFDPVTGMPLAEEGSVRQPWRVVVDSRLRLLPSARLLQVPGRVLVATLADQIATERASALQVAGAELLGCPATVAGQVDLPWLLGALGRLEVNELLVEAGATLVGALVRAGVVDELVVYLAPQLLGDAGRGMVRLGVLTSLAERVEWTWVSVRSVDRDLKLVLRPVAGDGLV
jgi:diaminohydroxyphosphoribosylaminopyrimidine deaminase/5-amino-6-(5-phosphoribosylamino)uracil reductase